MGKPGQANLTSEADQIQADEALLAARQALDRVSDTKIRNCAGSDELFRSAGQARPMPRPLRSR